MIARGGVHTRACLSRREYKDKEAPIFGIADLGIVGDVHTVLPKLIEALENR